MILITGSGGFIGKNFVKNDFRFVTSNQELCNSDNFFYKNTINGKTKWGKELEGVDSIIHLAGLAHSKEHSTEALNSVNVDGTLKLAKDASVAGVKRFVFVSSANVFFAKNNKNKYFSNSPLTQSKYTAELGLKKIGKETGLEVVIVRPVFVYGLGAPGNFDKLVHFITKFHFLPFKLIQNKRDFIAVQNLVDLLICCAKHPDAPGHIFLASDCESVSIKEFTNAIAKGLDTRLIQLPIPTGLIQLAGKFLANSAIVEQLVGNLEVDSSNLKKVLDWTPPYTMEESMTFLKEQK